MLTSLNGSEIGHVCEDEYLTFRTGVPLYARWCDAVVFGGRGAVAAALTELDCLIRAARSANDCALLSFAHSTSASLYRQAGQHGIALGIDGEALRVGAAGLRASSAGSSGSGEWDRWLAAAAADALINLAADNLGLAHFGASSRLLRRARNLLAEVGGVNQQVAKRSRLVDWLTVTRPQLRLGWVSAELCLYTGDAASALDHGLAALALARDTPECTVRHRVKTELIVAAATGASGNTDDAVVQSGELAQRAADASLLPLQWAALSLQNGLKPEIAVGTELIRVQRILAARGMPFIGQSQDR